jgi:hypothetical protein
VTLDSCGATAGGVRTAGLAAAQVWLEHHRKIAPQGLFALYVAGYFG